MAIRLCICLFICTSVCRHAYRPLSLSVSVIAKCAVFIPRPRCDAFPEETLGRLIWGWAHVKLIAFQSRRFWQWYWWMGPWKMWHAQHLAVIWCWCYEILMSSIYLSQLTDLIRLININMSSIVCASCVHVSIYLCGHIIHSVASLCAHEHDWVLVCMCDCRKCVCTYNILNVKLQWYYHIARCTVKSDYSSSTYIHVYSQQCSLFVILLMQLVF